MSEPSAEVDYSAPIVSLDAAREQKLGSELKGPSLLRPPGGGGTSDGMDPWQQTVETRLGELRTDVRDLGKKVDGHFMALMAALGTGFLILGGGLITAYLRLADAIAAIPKH